MESTFLLDIDHYLVHTRTTIPLLKSPSTPPSPICLPARSPPPHVHDECFIALATLATLSYLVLLADFSAPKPVLAKPRTIAQPLSSSTTAQPTQLKWGVERTDHLKGLSAQTNRLTNASRMYESIVHSCFTNGGPPFALLRRSPDHETARVLSPSDLVLTPSLADISTAKPFYWVAMSDYPDIDALLYDPGIHCLYVIQSTIQSTHVHVPIDSMNKARNELLPPFFKERRNVTRCLLIVAPEERICTRLMHDLLLKPGEVWDRIHFHTASEHEVKECS
ncbi:hypothetical protein AX16_009707 [Volvariella volvacea WC 439]|nr:hypothetical protein AX16_009707 [Volvariella volvacea WC 439]